MKKALITFLGMCCLCSVSWSQTVDSWQAFTSFSTVNGMVSNEDNEIFVATEGGVFSVFNFELERTLSPIDGLHALSPSALDIAANGEIWFGFSDGTVQAFDLASDSFTDLGDIRRADQFSQRAILKIVAKGDTIYTMTSFGVVLWNATRKTVIDSYVKFGDFDRASPMRDLFVDGDSLFIVNQQGLAKARDKGDLQNPSVWQTTPNAILPVNSVDVIVHLPDGRRFLSGSGQNLSFNAQNQSWELTSLFGQGQVLRFQTGEKGVLAIKSNQIWRLQNGQAGADLLISEGGIRSAIVDGNELIWGTQENGIAKRGLDGGQIGRLLPNGPALNAFLDVKSNNGILLSASSSSPGRRSGFTNTGYYFLRDGQWQNFSPNDIDEFRTQNFRSIWVTDLTQDFAFLGSWGKGFAVHDLETDEIQLITPDNSILDGLEIAPNFAVIAGLDTDTQGDLWVGNFFARRIPLYHFDMETRELTEIEKAPGVPNNVHYWKLFVDSFDQKWISLVNPQTDGLGLLIFDEGESLTDEADDRSVVLNTITGNLPNNKINAFAQDQFGEVWIATDRGVARFLFPDFILEPEAGQRQAQWLITEDQEPRTFFLRDVKATALAVNAANQKWIGTEGDGAWLVNETGGIALRHFTAENSPLISNSIESIAIDGETGTVFFATDLGLVSFTDVAKESEEKVGDLFIFPNPYNYNRNSGQIFIEGLRGENMIRILGVDGRLVRELPSRGGRVAWDGFDFQGRKLPSGVYLVVAVSENGGSRGFGKVAIIK